MKLGIYGAGSLGYEILDLANAINKQKNRWAEIFFIDDAEKPADENSKNGWLSFFEVCNRHLPRDIEIVIGVGEPRIRKIISDKIKARGYSLAELIHPGAHIGAKAVIEPGVVVQYGCFISCNTILRENSFVQPNALIGHNSIIGHDSVISSLVSIAGDCEIGGCSYIGLNVPVKEGLKIGANVIIGMGSSVVRDIPDNVIALGNPARPMKQNENSRVFKS